MAYKTVPIMIYRDFSV